MTFGSLFAGIGGFDLGLERAGFTTSFQVEIDPFCQKVLAKHWPTVRRHDDVKTFPPTNPEEWKVDVLCGGFPCQDISYAGKGAGIEGERSGLWSDYARIIGLLRPRYVIVENVGALIRRGLSRVLLDLAQIGYDAEWQIISAADVGAPHLRKRVWIVAYPNSETMQRKTIFGLQSNGDYEGVDADTNFHRLQGECEPEEGYSKGEEIQTRGEIAGVSAEGKVVGGIDRSSQSGGIHWAVEPPVGRLAHGVPNRVAKLRSLGNAVVPQIVEWIGRRIKKFDEN